MRRITTFVCFIIISSLAFSQNQRPYPYVAQSPSQIYHQIKKLNFLGSVLYVGAHPDDENNYLISYMSNVLNARVGYLALNRGDGGQNVLGPEMRELLGVMRTEELLDARSIEGTYQMFTRAADFGFSRNPEDALNHWDKKKILGDVVWAFRRFKPDVVIDRFDHRIFEGTHGHHTTSAILSYEAFDLSGKDNQYKDQLKYTNSWQPKRLFYNYSTSGFFGVNEDVDQENSLNFALDDYLDFIGIYNHELASYSRSQHKSQAMGSAGSRPILDASLEPLKGDFVSDVRTEAGIFSGINTTWSRLGKKGEEVGEVLKKVEADFDFKAPQKSIPELLTAYTLILDLDNEHWKVIKSQEIKEIIANIVGLNLSFSSTQEFAVRGDKVPVVIEAANSTKVPVILNKVTLKNTTYTINQEVKESDSLRIKRNFIIDKSTAYTSPYWLKGDYSRSWYDVEDRELIGLPETPLQFVADFDLTIDGVQLHMEEALKYKDFDQRKGEVNEPFAVVPDVSIKAHDHVVMFNEGAPKQLKFDVKTFKPGIDGKLKLQVPEGWKTQPAEYDLSLKKRNSKESVVFTITPSSNKEGEGEIKPLFTTNEGETFNMRLHIIDYDHIPTQTVVLPETVKVNNARIKTAGKKIAYIPGAGDEMPQSLKKIGYDVALISSDNLNIDELEEYDAVILGIRIYNIDKDIVANQDILFDYVKQGGTLITQYSQSYGMLTEKIAPYKLKTAPLDRVTNEKAEVNFLAPDHAVLNTPNKITSKDFKDWVQERGLYFGHEWDKALTPILGMHDKGHDELQGSLLVGKYGKGYYVYTGLGFFRQLPNGNAGAFKLFANLIALGNE